MITNIDSLQYNPCENQVEKRVDINQILKNYDESQKLDRMFFYGDEEIDFLGIGYDDNEMKFVMSSEPTETELDEESNQIVPVA